MFSSVFLIGLSAAGRPLTSYLSPAWEAIGTFTYYPLKAWCWWGEWTSSWKIPAHLHISYLWLKSASLPLRVERCCLFYILKKKKSRGWNLTVGLSDNPHFHSAVTPPCHSAYIMLGGLNASWWELILNSPALKTFFFFFFLERVPFLDPNSLISLSIPVGWQPQRCFVCAITEGRGWNDQILFTSRCLIKTALP